MSDQPHETFRRFSKSAAYSVRNVPPLSEHATKDLISPEALYRSIQERWNDFIRTQPELWEQMDQKTYFLSCGSHGESAEFTLRSFLTQHLQHRLLSIEGANRKEWEVFKEHQATNSAPNPELRKTLRVAQCFYEEVARRDAIYDLLGCLDTCAKGADALSEEFPKSLKYRKLVLGLKISLISLEVELDFLFEKEAGLSRRDAKPLVDEIMNDFVALLNNKIEQKKLGSASAENASWAQRVASPQADSGEAFGASR